MATRLRRGIEEFICGYNVFRSRVKYWVKTFFELIKKIPILEKNETTTIDKWRR